jgi:lipopolysaccharide/colanic/teichoic acid biosynthesis glycosyltransferase
MIRRLLDIIVSGTALLLCCPLLLAIGALIRLDSSGPIFFRQTRVGRNGVRFQIWKLRTMVTDAAGLGPGITAAGDSRVTRVGAWLRRTKLDELPQLVNVLRGEMSFVGPRPEVPKYVAFYTEHQSEVLGVRPGITGPAQMEFRNEEALLEGANPETEYVQRILPAKLRLDLEYVRSRSLAGDLSILVRTAFCLFHFPHKKRTADCSRS